MSTSVSRRPIAERELEQIERADAITATPVVCIHGLWLLPSSWETGWTSSAWPAEHDWGKVVTRSNRTNLTRYASTLRCM
jgi:hypothetical protein